MKDRCFFAGGSFAGFSTPEDIPVKQRPEQSQTEAAPQPEETRSSSGSQTIVTDWTGQRFKLPT